MSSKWIKRDVSKTKIRLDTSPFIHFNDKYFRTEEVQNYLSQFARVFWIAFATFGWSLWTTRNKFTIEHLFPNCPSNCLFRMVVIVEQWSLLVKVVDVGVVTLVVSKIRASAITQNPDENSH